MIKINTKSYFGASRTLSFGVILIIPLIVAYELLAIALQHQDALAPRNGVDSWFRAFADSFEPVNYSSGWFLDLVQLFGYHGVFVLGILFIVLMLALSISLIKDKPKITGQFLLIAILESGIYVWILALLSTLFAEHLSTMLMISQYEQMNLMMAIGAGVFEELLFRAFGYGLLTFLFIRIFAARNQWLPKIVFALFSAFLFSWAHDFASLDFGSYVFLYRFAMGVLFCLLYEFRGLGIAVWTHALYDVFVIFLG